MIKNSIIITILFFVSSVLSFICQMLYGKYFGAGGNMDIYYALNSIPNIVIGVVPAVFSSLLIPSFPQYEDRGELEKFITTLNNKVYIFAFIVVVVVGMFCIAQAFSIASNALPLALIMCAFLLTTAFFSIINGYYTSYINYKKKFVQVSLTSLMTYSSIIFMVVCFNSHFGVAAIAMGLLLGAILRFATMRNIMVLPKETIYLKINYRSVFSKVLMVFATLLPFSSFPAIAYFWAGSMEEGAVSYLGYSHSFEGVLSVAGSMGIATVSFPDLAKSLNTTDKNKIISTLSHFMLTLKAVFFIACIIISFCCVFAVPVSSLLLERGEFTHSDIKNLCLVLPFYFVGGGIIAQLNLIRNVFYSLKLLKNFSMISVSVTLFFFIAAIWVGDNISYVGVGIMECLLWLTFLLLSLISLVKQTGNFISAHVYVDCLKYILTPIAIAIIIKLLFNVISGMMPLIITLTICGLFHVISSVLILSYILKAKEAKLLVSKVLGVVHLN